MLCSARGVRRWCVRPAASRGHWPETTFWARALLRGRAAAGPSSIRYPIPHMPRSRPAQGVRRREEPHAARMRPTLEHPYRATSLHEGVSPGLWGAHAGENGVQCCRHRCVVSERPLRLMVFDRTCTTRGVGLSTAWWAGSGLYRALGRLDATRGVGSWREAFHWLATYEASRPIAEIQYWGHGRWGCCSSQRRARSKCDRSRRCPPRLDARGARKASSRQCSLLAAHV